MKMNTKKLILLVSVIVTVVICMAISVNAASESDLTFELNSDGKSYCVYYCRTSAKGELSIPAIYNGLPVTKIDDSAFYSCRGLTGITVPDSVTSIGSGAFSSCSGLRSINLTSKVVSIGDYAFSNCSVLTDITIPGSVTVIGSYAFYNCTGLTDITINDGTIRISKSAFEGCESALNIVIPDSVTTIGCDAFADTGYYNKQSNWIDGVLYIGNYLIKASDTVTSHEIRRGTKRIADNAFNGCAELDSVIIPVSLIAIGNEAFKDVNLKYVFYEGSTAERNNIVIDVDGNEILISEAVWHYKATGHTKEIDKAVAPGCTSDGLTEGSHCSLCGEVFLVQEVIPALGHKNKTTKTKATLTENGKSETKCTVCGEISSSTVFYKPKTFSLSVSSYTYDGKVKTPTVTVKDSNGKRLNKNTNYSVSYEKGRKNPGQYTVTITFKGDYSGTKKINFTIKPKTVTSIKATQTTTSIKLTWSKVTGATGYRIYKYNTKTKKYKKLKDVRTNSLAINKLKAGTKYKYKVRAYTKDSATVWGDYSKILETATKPASPVIKTATSVMGKGTFTWSDVSGENGYQLYYSAKKDSGYKKCSSPKANATKVTVTKLTSGKTYYFKLRSFVKTGSGYIYSAWSEIKKLKIKEDYSAVLDEYKHAIAETYYGYGYEFDFDEEEEEGYYYYDDFEYINPEWISMIKSYKSPFYYGTYDINSDGIEEFVVSGKYEIINIFTYYKNKPYPLFGKDACFGERAHLNVYTNGVICEHGSGGAAYYGWTFVKYMPNSTEFKHVEKYYRDMSDGFKCTKTDEYGRQYLVSESYLNQRLDYYSGIKEISPKWKKIVV